MRTGIRNGMAPLVRCVPQGKILSLFIVSLFIYRATAQADSLAGFDKNGALKHASLLSDAEKRKAVIIASERAFIKTTYFSQPGNSFSASKGSTLTNNCDNLDFESNSANGWDIKGDHEIVSEGTDPFCGFQKVFPGAGKHSLRLNSTIFNNKNKFSASASRALHITPQSNFINLHFAMVFLNFPHDSSNAARFKIRLLDSTGRVVFCPQFTCYYSTEKGAVGVNNFSVSPVKGINAALEYYPVTYSGWQSVGINLSEFNGRNLKLEVSCNWCSFNVDWAYCYLDADCKSATVTEIKCTDLPAALAGPPGFGRYAWYGPDTDVLQSATQKLNIVAPGTYTLRCNQSNYCGQLPFTYVYVVTEKPGVDFSVSTQACSLDAVFKAHATNKNTSENLDYEWTFDDDVPGINRPVIDHVYKTGGYKSVQLTVSDNKGCKNHLTKSFSLGMPLRIVVKQTGGAGVLSLTTPEQQYQAFCAHGEKLHYEWTGAGYYTAGAIATINNEGLYRVVALDSATGCSDTVDIRVYFKANIPNVFTPNNDGVNDVFRFSLKNAKEIEAVVYDRWGNEVYETKNATIAWDGKNKNGQACSDGTFFYMLFSTNAEGEKASATGTVNLFR